MEPNGLRLSTGHTIPYDTRICFLQPHAPFVTQPDDMLSSAAAAGKHPPLDQFYPFRFSELRQLPAEHWMHKFTQTGPENLTFGHGPGACTGRWFLEAMLKVIILEVLRRYDVAIGPNGQSHGQDGYARPSPLRHPGTTMEVPDPEAVVYFRSRDSHGLRTEPQIKGGLVG